MRPRAKAKIRQEDFHADEEALKEYEASIAKNVVKSKGKRYKDEIASNEVVNIMADEIQAVYQEMGAELDEANARDKALTIWREMSLNHHITAREQAVEHVMCEEHDEKAG